MTVTVYSKDKCQQCKGVKRWLRSNGIAFNEINVSEQPEYIQEVKDLGFTSLPVVKSGDLVFSGLDIPKLNELKSRG